MCNKKSLVDKYSNSPFLRSLVSLIPHIGSSIDIVLTSKSAKWSEERIQVLLKDLDQKVANLGLSLEEVTNRIESEEFYDSLIKVFELTIKTRRKEKIKCFSNILTNRIHNKIEGTFVDSELSIVTLENMSIQEMDYFIELNKRNGIVRFHIIDSSLIDIESLKQYLEKNHIDYDRKRRVPDECKNKLGDRIVWEFLNDKRLIEFKQISNREQVPYSFGSSNYRMNQFINTQGEIEYKISDFGKEFLKWIEHHE